MVLAIEVIEKGIEIQEVVQDDQDDVYYDDNNESNDIVIVPKNRRYRRDVTFDSDGFDDG